MANRLDYYFRQAVTEAELDQGFQYAEDADRAQNVDAGLVGVSSGLVAAQQGTPDMTVQVSGGVAYAPAGERMNVPTTQNINVAADYASVATTVAGAGNEKYVSIFLGPDRALSDPRTDGNSLTVYFQRAESYRFRVVQGAEATSGTAVRPTLDGTRTLIADVRLVFGTTTVVNSMISTTRRQDTFAITGTPRAIHRGKTVDAISDLLSWYNSHLDGSGDRHTAAESDYAGGATWADGTTNPAATVEAQLDKIVNDLRATSSTSGGKRIGFNGAAGTLANGDNLLSTNVTDALNELVNVIGSGDAPSSIHASAAGGLPGGDLRGQLNNLDGRVGLKLVSVKTVAASDTTASGSVVDVTGAVLNFTGVAIGDRFIVFSRLRLARGTTLANDVISYAYVVDGSAAQALISGAVALTNSLDAGSMDTATGPFKEASILAAYTVTNAVGGTASIKIRHLANDGAHTVGTIVDSLIVAHIRG